MLEPAVTWKPYTDIVLQSLPPICTAGAHIWRARMPILCMENVKMHVPDRLLRQFGMYQHIPDLVPRLIRVDRSNIGCVIRVWRQMHIYSNGKIERTGFKTNATHIFGV